MTYYLSNKYAKNYCNRTILVQVIAEDVVACFFLKHGVYLTSTVECVAMPVSRQAFTAVGPNAVHTSRVSMAMVSMREMMIFSAFIHIYHTAIAA